MEQVINIWSAHVNEGKETPDERIRDTKNINRIQIARLI